MDDYGTAQSCPLFYNCLWIVGREHLVTRFPSSQSLVSTLRGGTCFSACRRAGESIGVCDMAGAGEPPLGDKTSCGGGALSLGMVGDDPPIPG